MQLRCFLAPYLLQSCDLQTVFSSPLCHYNVLGSLVQPCDERDVAEIVADPQRCPTTALAVPYLRAPHLLQLNNFKQRFDQERWRLGQALEKSQAASRALAQVMPNIMGLQQQYR